MSGDGDDNTQIYIIVGASGRFQGLAARGSCFVRAVGGCLVCCLLLFCIWRALPDAVQESMRDYSSRRDGGGSGGGNAIQLKEDDIL